MTLDELDARSRTLARDAFTDLLEGPILVFLQSVPVDAPREALANQRWLERVVELDTDSYTKRTIEDTHIPDEAPSRRFLLEGCCEVVPIAKSRKNSAFATMVTVGQAGDNDIVVRAQTVSRAHAYFTKVSNGWTVTDRRSANGTFVQGKQIPTGGSARLEDGMQIAFGPEVQAVFYAPDTAYDMLVERRRGAR
jgi:hypothetical protein